MIARQLCGFYYWVWMVVLPRFGGYEIVEEVENLKGGAKIVTLVRRYRDRSADHGEVEPLLRT